MKKKICIVVDGLQVGGIERVCLDYIKILQELQYKITVINLKPNLNDFEDKISDDVNIYHIPFSRQICPEQYTQLVKKNIFLRCMYPIIYIIFIIVNFFYKLFCKVAYTCCHEDYDIVVAFSSHFNDLTFVASSFVRAKRKISWCHGAIYEYLLISDGYINLYKKIKNIVVLVSESEKEVFVTNKDLKLNVYKLYNPTNIGNLNVNLDIVNKLKKEYGHFLLMVSRFDYPYKDPYTVIKALSILYNKYNYKKLQLVFVGDGKDLKKAKKFAQKLDDGIEANIHFVGKRFDVQNFYKAAYIYVQAGAATEGLPTTMIEAMHFGLPEVVTDVKVGPREILGDNEYGLLCKPLDSKDMAKKINALLSNDELYKSYQRKENERKLDFDSQTIQKRLKIILDDILLDTIK